MSERKDRIPPGQMVTSKFPVFKYSDVPNIDESAWKLKIFGAVDKELTFNWNQFLKLPKVEVIADMHCVTKWSRLDNKWEGVLFKTFTELAKVKPTAKFVLIHSYDGYSTNVPLDTLMDNDVLLAYKHDGEFLTPEHGKPVRLVVPKRYGWKSAKWISGLEFLVEEKRGYWEQNGYHNIGDPWKNQRFKWQETCESSSQ